MKPSQYNCFYAIDDAVILGFNTLSTALLALTPAEFAGLRCFCAEPGAGAFDRLALPQLGRRLAEAGMVVDAETDELAQVRAAARGAARRGSLPEPDHYTHVGLQFPVCILLQLFAAGPDDERDPGCGGAVCRGPVRQGGKAGAQVVWRRAHALP